jgi:chromosome segregation ATPase
LFPYRVFFINILKSITMQLNNGNDPTSISIRLNELRYQFDQAIREGENFENVKEIHSQIKELECYLTALQWQPNRNPRREFMREEPGERFRHIKEPRPLL